MKKSNLTIEALLEIIEAQAGQIRQLEARIKELEQRLNKNSSNSSKPPSSDGLSKPPRTSSLRENGKNKSGGQPGHKGETLKQTETPDIIKKHVLTTCPNCQHSLLPSPLFGIMKQGFELQVKPNGCTWHRLKQRLTITYLPNENHYSMAFQAQWSTTTGTVITIYSESNMGFVINIICAS